MSASYAFRPILKGDTGSLAFYLRRIDILTLERLPYALTDHAVELTLRAAGVSDQIFTRASGLVVGDADGSIHRQISAADSAARPVGVTTFRLRITDSEGRVTTVLTGTIPFLEWPMNEPIPLSTASPRSAVSGVDAPFEVVEVAVPYNEGTVAEAVRQAKQVVSQLTIDQITGLREVLGQQVADALVVADATSIVNTLIFS